MSLLPEGCLLGPRVLATGGRDYANWLRLCAVMDEIHALCAIECLIEGEAPGLDRLSKLWAVARRIPVLPLKADWTGRGVSAGSHRNAQMIVRGSPDVVVAFPGDKGTRNMLLQAKRFGVPSIDLRYEMYGWTGSP